LFVDLLVLCFHNLTNPFSRNSRVFTSIQNPQVFGSFPVALSTSRRSRITSCAFSSACALFFSLAALFQGLDLCFQSFAHSCAKGGGYLWNSHFWWSSDDRPSISHRNQDRTDTLGPLPLGIAAFRQPPRPWRGFVRRSCPLYPRSSLSMRFP
jgi:hypothetical protein